jgi:cytochrome c-type protein NapC
MHPERDPERDHDHAATRDLQESAGMDGRHPWLDEHNLFSGVTLACAAVAVVILVWYVVVHPPLHRTTKLWLLLGLGVFPIAAAAGSNVQGYEATQHRVFCGSCHVMTPYAQDSNDPNSKTLSATHARNQYFGADNCYACHADYGMFGTVVTKLGGMRHVWLAMTEFRGVSLEESKKRIHLLKPYPNQNCMQCHSTTTWIWRRVPDHASALDDVVAGRVGCASPGCHGYAHPYTKPITKEIAQWKKQ